MPPTTKPIEPSQDEGSPRERSGRRRLAFVAAGIFTVATFALWLYAFFVYDPGLKVDELADRTFPTEAEEVCAGARSRLEALPSAPTAENPVERAEVIDQANAILSGMLDELEPLVPAEQGRVSAGIEEWLEDWRTHVEDRQRYADALRRDPSARFMETMKANRQLSRAIDGFAEVNRMESCATPGDVG